jgi:hypothetical protein
MWNTIARIDGELVRMKAGESADLVAPFQRVVDALITASAFTDEQKRDAARVLLEIVHNRGLAPAARRTADAKKQLHVGFTRIVAPCPELARRWAEIAPRLVD